ncbi:MAG: hypothetical protein R6W78_05975 [Bacteroidales bacterium]
MNKNTTYQILFILLVIMLLKTNDVFAQLVSVQAQLDSNTIVIGDQIGLNIEVKKNKGDIVKFPAFGDYLT